MMDDTKADSSHQGDVKRATLIGPKRALFQWLCSLLIVMVPFIPAGGDSLLRLDFGTLTLHAFGHTFPITDLSLFLLLTIALVLLFLLVTLAFGRAWCGWACPQTTLVDLIEWSARKIGVTVRAGTLKASRGQTFLLHLIYLALALLVGANLTWYFVAPYDFFPALLAGELHWVAVTFLLIVAATTYFNLAFLRRLFCKEFCPYGRFQTVLVDPGTLTLHYHPDEAPRCIKCGACVRNCPTGIDIRRGYQIECINCGRCLDACRQVMARRQQAGIIRYTFGLDGKGVAALVNVRMVLVAMALFGVCAGLVFATVQRSDLSIKAGRNPSLLPRILETGQVVNFYSVYLTNRTNQALEFELVATGGDDIIMTGSANMRVLEPGERKRFDVALETGHDTLAESRPVTLEARGRQGERYGTTTIFLTRPLERE